jgi:hypothetical protein
LAIHSRISGILSNNGLWVVALVFYTITAFSLAVFYLSNGGENMNLKEIKKVLMTQRGKISMGPHTKEKLEKRGYSKGDIVSAIFSGEIVERQSKNKVAIAGRDKDENPIVVVIAKNSDSNFFIVTVMPPIDHQRFKDCV